MGMIEDTTIRLAAFEELNRRISVHGSLLSWNEISEIFWVGDQKVYLANRARGIFKPQQMKRRVLSVKSTIPRTGRSRRYIDFRSGDSLYYAFQGENADKGDNLRLKEAFEDQTPLVYFCGVSEGMYEVIFPVFVCRWLPAELRVEIEVAAPVSAHAVPLVVKEEDRKYRCRQGPR